MAPQPVLTKRISNEITATMLDVSKVWGAKDGQPGREELLRVVAASLEPLVEIKKIELRYSRRMVTAMELRDTPMLMAAVFGLQIDMRGGLSPQYSDDAFVKSMFMRAMRIASNNQIMTWFDNNKFSTFANMRERRALIEYFSGKLVELDAAVLEKFPEAAPEDEHKSTMKP